MSEHKSSRRDTCGSPPAGQPDAADVIAVGLLDGSAPTDSSVSESGETRTRRTRYDPEFRAAVEEGYLTPSQAFARGKRSVWAERLVASHHLAIEVALAVADNRISLIKAIQEQGHAEGAPAMPTRPEIPSRAPLFRPSTIALLGVFAAVCLWLFAAGGPQGEVPGLDAGVRVVTSDEGRILQIVGPDAASVLEAYCASGDADRQLDAVGLMEPVGGEPGLRLGLLRDRAAPDEHLAIYISLDRYSGRWTAGNGRSPLDAFKGPR